MKAFMLCPFCSKGHYIKLNNDQDRRLGEYRNGRGAIQDIFTDLNSTEREFIKTGMCLDCQKMIFGSAESNLITER